MYIGIYGGFVVFAILCVIFVISLFIADLMVNSAVMKGYNPDEMHIFAICFFLGIIGYIYVLSLPDKITQQQNKEIIELLKAQQTNNKNIENDELPEL